MRIGWLHDHRQSERSGGAQLSSETMALAAPDWAEVVMCYPGEMADCDSYVLNNVKFFGYQEVQQATSKPYIVYEHDHWNVVQPWQRGRIRPIIKGAAGVIFLSPLHRGSFCAKHGVQPEPAWIVPSPVDVTRFAPAVDKAGTVWLGEFCPQKGIEAACRWAETYGPVDFWGWGPLVPTGPNVRVRGGLCYQDVPEVLARAQTFLFLPAFCEPFGRTVAEAYLSGCEMVCNDRVGVLSWGWEAPEEWVAALAAAPRRFWEIVEEVLL